MQYSVVNYKTVKENLSFRIDADFFRPDYLEILDKIQSKKHQSLKSKDHRVFSGPFGSFLKSESYKISGHPFIRISDIQDVYIEKERMVYLDDEEFERVKKYQLDINDIVFSKIESGTQKQIKEKIVEMYETKKSSKSLLEIAKRGVEMAIEKDEKTSEKWIESKVEKLKTKL